MTSQPGKQAITINIFPSISRSKGHQTMKFRQLIEGSVRNIFFKNDAENEARRLVQDNFLFLKNF